MAFNMKTNPEFAELPLDFRESGDASFGGNTPGASLWDFNGSGIGFTDGTKTILPQGNFVDITVNPNAAAGNIQAAYASISMVETMPFLSLV